MAIYNKTGDDNGVWTEANTIHMKSGDDNGVWTSANNVYVKVGDDNGVWTMVYEAAFQLTATISANTAKYNIETVAQQGGWDDTLPVIANITVAPGVVVYSDQTGTAAFSVPSNLTADSQVTLTNQGTIVGMGGAGGSYPGNAGAAGGEALFARYQTKLVNNGTIASGGGGGSGGPTPSGRQGSPIGQKGQGRQNTTWYQYGGGGGGGGGSSLAPAPGGPAPDSPGQAGGDTGGSGGTRAGAGGQRGQAGQPSSAAGGNVGRAIDGVSNVSIQTTGTITGPQVN